MMKRLRPLFLILAFAVSACGSSATPPPAAPTALPSPTLAPSATPITPTPTLPPTETPTPPPPIERVLIVSFDGLRPDALIPAKMENLLALIQSGAYSLSAHTIMPSVTLPAHASMLVGTCPYKHIARWNEYVPENGYAMGTDIFDLVHSFGLQTVMIVGKQKLTQITEPTSLDFSAWIDETDKIADIGSIESVSIQQANRGFNLMLVHFPDGDFAGHEYGWMSGMQLRAYRNNDKTFGKILETLKQNGLYDSTIIIVTSDHGGHDTTHGYDVPEDMTIPWVISGPRVKPGALATQINTMDTAATAAFVLGLPLPAEWDGVPVYEAFGLPVIQTSQPCP
ncbi:MAG: alkaline phosphatase [Anaerolineales bacterium]